MQGGGPIVIEPAHAIGAIVYHRTGETRGIVIAYRVTGDGAPAYEVRWGTEEMSEAVHSGIELSETPTF